MPFGSIFTTKTPITAAHLLNDRVLSFYEQHPYKLYLAVNDIDHTKTKARALQGIVRVNGLELKSKAS